jgi:foldase protein PrsA
MAQIFEKIKYFFKGLIYRLKPRLNLQWIVVFATWVIVLVYIGFGVFFGIQIYGKHSESALAKFSSRIYPFPAAFVGGNIIWAKDYYRQLSYIRQFSQETKQTSPEASQVRSQIIDQLIERRLLEWEASKNGLRVTSKEVDAAYQKIVDEAGGQAAVQKVLRGLFNMSEKEFKDIVRYQVTKEKIQNELIAQVKVRHILIKDEGRANEVANKARSGENWDDLAKTYSEDLNTRDKGGDLGWLGRGNLVIDNKQVPEFEEAAFKAKIGEIFGPVKTQVGFQIGKVEDKKGKIQESYSNWLASIKKETKIFIFIR